MFENDTKHHSAAILFWSAFGIFSQLAFVRLFSTTAGETTYYGNIFFLVAIFAMSCGFFCRSLSRFYYWIPASILLNYLIVIWLGTHNLLQELPGEFQWYNAADLFSKEVNFDLQLAVFLLCTSLTLSMILIGSNQGKAVISSGYKEKGYILMAAGGILGALIFTVQNQFFPSQWSLIVIWMFPLTAFVYREYRNKHSRLKTYSLISAILLILVLGWTYSRSYEWSPYQRISLKLSPTRDSLYVTSNDFYISTIQLRSAAILNRDPEWLSHAAAFQFIKAGDRALILGSGGGTQDVREALYHGAKSVVAVEIDPVFVALGKKFDPDRSYFNPAVRAYIDDARHYLNTSRDKFDFIYLPFLDSQTNASNQSRFRLDSFLYTEEGLRLAYQKLNDGGVLFVSFAAVTPWIRQRMFFLLENATQHKVRVFAIPNQIQTTYAMSRGKEIENFPPPYVEKTRNFAPNPKGIVPTDDWPFLYSRDSAIPIEHLRLLYVVCIGMLCIFLFCQRFFPPSVSLDSRSTRGMLIYAFFSGAAFFFIQLRTISALTPWFGASYVSQAVVVIGIIVSSILGALIAWRFRLIRLNIAWIVLFITLIFGYRAFDFFHPLYGSVLPSVTLFLVVLLFPISCAGYIYLRYLEGLNSEQILRMQMWNLIGGAIGGLVEASVVILGFRNSLWIAVGFYSLAFLSVHVPKFLLIEKSYSKAAVSRELAVVPDDLH